MKVYLFEKESGFYLGEDFDSYREAMEEDGVTPLAPPVTGPGEVAVFNRLESCWRVLLISDLHKPGGAGGGHE
jgi:hypothetical protein